MKINKAKLKELIKEEIDKELQKIINEAAGKKYTEADVKRAIAKYKGKKVGVVSSFNFANFLNKMATIESRFNPYSKNGQFIGAFQLGEDHHKGDKDLAYNPARAAAYLYDFFSNKMAGLYASNKHLKRAVRRFGEPTLYYLAHNQGKSGAVRILYTAIGKEKELSAGKLDKATLGRMIKQNISAINPILKNPKFSNQKKALAFINYFKKKYNI